jgi:hypothetical protein
LTIVFIPQIARVAESVTTQVRGRDYVEAARASGAGAFTIVRVHVLGNVLGPVFVYATSLIAVSMILASGLSFLGLGVKPPEPEWGLMLNTAAHRDLRANPGCALPGAMIFITRSRSTCSPTGCVGDGQQDHQAMQRRHRRPAQPLLDHHGLQKHFPLRGDRLACGWRIVACRRRRRTSSVQGETARRRSASRLRQVDTARLLMHLIAPTAGRGGVRRPARSGQPTCR